MKELEDLRSKIEAWHEKVEEHNQERKRLQRKKYKLLKQLNKLEEKYGVKDAD